MKLKGSFAWRHGEDDERLSGPHHGQLDKEAMRVQLEAGAILSMAGGAPARDLMATFRDRSDNQIGE